MIKLEMQTANMDLKQVKNIWFRSHNFCDRDEECLCLLRAHRVKSRVTFFLDSVKSGNLATSL